MSDVLDALGAFLADNVPSFGEALAVGVPSLIFSGAALAACSWLRRARGWQAAYTRKLFHFVIFFTAAGVHATLGTRALCIFGGATSLVLFAALSGGRRGFLLAALVRPADAPREVHFIVAPYLATLLGGVLANALYGRAAIFGYAITGIADAVAEPVGARWGRHRYRVLSLRGVPATRSLEGSLAVFLAALLAGFAALTLYQGELPGAAGLGAMSARLALVAFCAAVIEAVSPHGWDNFTLQLAVSFVVHRVVN